MDEDLKVSKLDLTKGDSSVQLPLLLILRIEDDIYVPHQQWSRRYLTNTKDALLLRVFSTNLSF